MSDSTFRLLRGWLILVSVAMIPFGYALVFGSQTALFDWFNDAAMAAFWPATAVPAASVAMRSWVYAVLGATLSSWAVCFVFILWGPFARRERWAWWSLVISLLVWFPPDTAMSWYYGVNVNVAFNVVALVSFGIPLIAVAPAFFRRSE